MRRRTQAYSVMELTFGTSLLLGPLVYALSLPSGEAPVCEPTTSADPPVIVIEEVCDAEDPPAPALEPVPVPEPEPVPEPALELPAVDAPFLFVYDERVVLHSSADPEWGHGELRAYAGGATHIAGKPAQRDALPLELQALASMEFDLYGEDGQRCTTRLGELHLIAQYEGWDPEIIGAEIDWGEIEDPEEDIPAATLLPSVWNNIEARWLVAELPADAAKRCSGAIWARDSALPEPALLTRDEGHTRATVQARARFSRSERLAELREEYTQWTAELREGYTAQELEDYFGLDELGSWNDYAKQFPVETWTWRDAEGRTRYVGLEFGEVGEGCGDSFYSKVRELLWLGEDGGLVDAEVRADPDMVFDLDGDGRYERLYLDEDELSVSVSSEDEGLEFELYVEQEWMCPC